MNYRPDIDGLRAIAVLAVVLFHLGTPGFGGGFVGVDVFFVISGYLITRQISERVEQGNFHFGEFYGRRIRRLLPALLATIIASTVLAAVILLPADMAAFSGSAIAALFSVSNIVFYLESGYWAAASELKPLLHTWSLGVEEQFYLVWPLLIVALLALRRHLPLTLSLLLIGGSSLAACVVYTGVDRDAAFYLAPFRVFQFVAGALLLPLSRYASGWSASGRTAALAQLSLWLGLLLIVGSVAWIDDQSGFPGLVVLAPTLGATLVLFSGGLPGGAPALSFRLLGNRLALWFGATSYALYLAHWPIIVFYRYEYGIALNWQEQLTLALIMLIATCLLHYGIERRFYRRTSSENGHRDAADSRAFFGGLATLLALTAAVNAHSWQSGGWGWRYPNLAISAEAFSEASQRRYSHLREACALGRLVKGRDCPSTGGTRVLVLGNSHEPDGYNAIRAGYAEHHALQFLLFGTTNRCGSLSLVAGRVVAEQAECQQRLDTLFEPELLASIDWVIYSANRPFTQEPANNSKDSLVLLLTQLKTLRPDIGLITLGGFINTDVDCSLLINKRGTPDACKDRDRVAYFEEQPEQEGYFDAIMALTDHYVDRVALLCPGRELQGCQITTAEGSPAFYDRHHLSLEFAEQTGRLYATHHPGLFDKTAGADGN